MGCGGPVTATGTLSTAVARTLAGKRSARRCLWGTCAPPARARSGTGKARGRWRCCRKGDGAPTAFHVIAWLSGAASTARWAGSGTPLFSDDSRAISRGAGAVEPPRSPHSTGCPAVGSLSLPAVQLPDHVYQVAYLVMSHACPLCPSLHTDFQSRVVSLIIGTVGPPTTELRSSSSGLLICAQHKFGVTLRASQAISLRPSGERKRGTQPESSCGQEVFPHPPMSSVDRTQAP